MDKLTSAQVRKLKGIGQRMDPILYLGKAGLTEGFLATVRAALDQHELIKIRFSDHKEERKSLAPQLAEKSHSHLVTLIGNVVLLFRQQPDPEKRKIEI